MTDLEFTPAAYARWLQAQRPDFIWFLQQPEEAQAQMAELGAFHRVDSIIEQAEAIQNPELFSAQVYADTDPEAQDVLLRYAAVEAAAQMAGAVPQDAPQSTPADDVPSLAGVIARREAADEERIQATGKLRSFLGVLPDAVREDVAG